MAHWLKAAEGLFEVVDRRAKLVVGEQSDEQSNIQPPASNGQGSRAKRAKSKVKPQKRLSSNEAPTTTDTALEQTSAATLESEALSHKDKAVLSSENDGISPGHSSSQVSNEEQHTVDGDSSISVAPLCRTSSDNELSHDTVQGEVSTAVTSVDSVPPTSNGDLINKTSSIPPEENFSAPLAGEGIEVVQEVQSVDSSQNVLSEDKGTTMTIDEERSQSTNGDEPSNDDSLLKDTDLRVESQPDEKIQHKLKPDTDVKLDSHTDKKKIQEVKPVASPTKVQDQLDEAQGLLKSAVSTGQSKEARLARVCAGLSSRLQEYKSENSQLEELLVAERELSKSYEAHIRELQKDLSTSKSEVTRIESNMAEALATKNTEIEALVSSMDALKKQAALSEGNLASLQANMESIMRNRELTETRMMQALREELSSAERRAEEERAAHNATKMAAMEREVELEHRALDASTALARIQRTADDRTAKAVELEQKVALLEVECASLNQELQDMEARVRRGQKKSPEEANKGEDKAVSFFVKRITFITKRGTKSEKCTTHHRTRYHHGTAPAQPTTTHASCHVDSWLYPFTIFFQNFDETEKRTSIQQDRCIPYRLAKDDEGHCINLEKQVEVLMVSSPNRDDMVFPKGGWEDDETIEEAACREALEEAGVRGTLKETLLGVWEFRSKSNQEVCSPEGGCKGYMFALEVTEELDDWPEQNNRDRKWLHSPGVLAIGSSKKGENSYSHHLDSDSHAFDDQWTVGGSFISILRYITPTIRDSLDKSRYV